MEKSFDLITDDCLTNWIWIGLRKVLTPDRISIKQITARETVSKCKDEEEEEEEEEEEKEKDKKKIMKLQPRGWRVRDKMFLTYISAEIAHYTYVSSQDRHEAGKDSPFVRPVHLC